MGIFERIKINISDVKYFGLSVMFRHLGRLKENKQIKLRLPSGNDIFLRAGESDMAALRQVFKDKDYVIPAPAESIGRLTSAYEKIIKAGRTPLIIDAGANIGAASIFFRSFYPEAIIVAVEPDPGNILVLKKNSDRGKKFTVLEAAIGSEAGYVSVIQQGLGWATQTVRSEEGVKLTTIKEIISTFHDCDLFLVKVDIEGFEKDLFAYSTEWLALTSAVIIELHDWMLPGQGTSLSFQKAIAQYDFEMFFKGENLFYIKL